jgi:hypothetical protein
MPVRIGAKETDQLTSTDMERAGKVGGGHVTDGNVHLVHLKPEQRGDNLTG